jgi:hypothetical protein
LKQRQVGPELVQEIRKQANDVRIQNFHGIGMFPWSLF